MGDIGHLLEPEFPRLRRYARALTRDSIRAEDLIQSCLVRALSRQHLWREGSDLGAWLMTIMHNEFINGLRRDGREQVRLLALEMRSSAIPASDPETSYRVREVQRALARLPGWQREVVLRIGIEGEEYVHTAAALGIPVGTVRSRLGRARESLRAMTDYDRAPRKTMLARGRLPKPENSRQDHATAPPRPRVGGLARTGSLGAPPRPQ